MVPGGRFTKGQALLRIDPRDYQVAMEQQRAGYNRARVELQLERGRKAVAEREWEVLSNSSSSPARSNTAQLSESDDDGRALALREPQLGVRYVR